MSMIGARIRQIREQQDLSQKDIEERIGLQRCYVSRVENGHTVPSLETVEKFATALGVPLHQLFQAQDDLLPKSSLTSRPALGELAGEDTITESELRFLLKLRELLSRMVDPDRQVLLAFAKKLATQTVRER
jgi:transcriptional regulator with XRE-family HTH domain